MVQINNKLIVVIILLMYSSCSYGQITTSGDYSAQLNFDLSGGMTIYEGDLTSSISPVGGFGARFTFERFYSFKLRLRGGRLKGGDSYAGKFENDYFQTGLNFGFNLSKFARLYRNIPKFNIVPYIGAAAIFNNSKKVAEPDEGTNDLIKSYNGTNIIYPIGVTLKYYLSLYFDITLDSTFYLSSSDKLDGYFGGFSGNEANDYFRTITLGISYKLLTNNQQDHTDWKPRRENY